MYAHVSKTKYLRSTYCTVCERHTHGHTVYVSLWLWDWEAHHSAQVACPTECNSMLGTLLINAIRPYTAAGRPRFSTHKHSAATPEGAKLNP